MEFNNRIDLANLIYNKLEVNKEVLKSQFQNTNSSIRFFYLDENDQLAQLVYKKYLIDDKMGINYQFRQQLKNQVTCENVAQNVDKLQYIKKDLISYFEKYNKCIY